MRLLLGAAPAAAAAKAGGPLASLPLKVSLIRAMHATEAADRARRLEAARLLLPATPPKGALAALAAAGDLALPLIADLAACTALSPAQWQRVPAPCPGLGAALPAVLARSMTEAALLVGRLPVEVRERLRTGALCLGWAQRVLGVELERALVGQVLALAAGP